MGFMSGRDDFGDGLKLAVILVGVVGVFGGAALGLAVCLWFS